MSNKWVQNDDLATMVEKYNNSIREIGDCSIKCEGLESNLTSLNSIVESTNEKLNSVEDSTLKKDFSNVEKSSLKTTLVSNSFISPYVEASLEEDTFKVTLPQVESLSEGTSLKVKFLSGVHTGAMISVNNSSPIRIVTANGNNIKSGMISSGNCIELIYNGESFTAGLLGKDYIESSSSNIFLRNNFLTAEKWSEIEGEGKYPSKASKQKFDTRNIGDFIPEITFLKASVNEATSCGISYIEYDTTTGEITFFSKKKPENNLVFDCLLKMYGR